MKKSFLIATSAAALAALLVSCKETGEPQLQYYQTPFTYDIVKNDFDYTVTLVTEADKASFYSNFINAIR